MSSLERVNVLGWGIWLAVSAAAMAVQECARCAFETRPRGRERFA